MAAAEEPPSSLGGSRHLTTNAALEAADKFACAGQQAEVAAAAAARARVEAALKELAGTLSKAQAEVVSAEEALRCARAAEDLPQAPGDLGSATPGPGLVARPLDATAEESRSDDAIQGEMVNADTLPDTWPGSLEIRFQSASFADDPVARDSARRLSLTHSGSTALAVKRARTNQGSQSIADVNSDASGSTSRFVIHPDSICKLTYDIAGASFLTVDALAIPVLVAWEIPLSGFMLRFAWLTATFWTLDICINFFTAIHRNGNLISDLRTIRRDYLKGWFVPDTAIVTCDWLTLVLKSTGMRLLRFAKLGRFLRLLALFRFLKIARIIEGAMEVHMPDTGKLFLRFMKMFIVTLLYGHFIACLWTFIGRPGVVEENGGWTASEQMSANSVEFNDRSLGYQYATSFHWGMSQITLGAMEVVCTNVVERLYTVFCLISGLMFGSTLVSSLSATMLEAQMDKRENYLKMQQMRRYLREQRVDRVVSAQVQRQLANRLTTKAKLTQSQVSGFEKLSASLRAALQFEMLSPYLKSLPLFRLWISLDTAFVRLFCLECVDVRYLPLQDDLFLAGSVAKYACYFYSGRITYTQEPETSPMTDQVEICVQEGSWLAEAALWTVWTHVGSAVADEYTEVARVDVEKIASQLKRSLVINRLTLDYCKSFHRRLQVAKPPTSIWPDDLQVPLTEWHDMVLAMNRDSQAVIGLDALKQVTLGRKWNVSMNGLTELGTEVEAGKSTVMLTAAGELERVTSLVAFKIYNSQGSLLIQIGKEEAGHMKPSCQLLGGKQERGELVTETFQRLLGSKLAKIANHVEVIKTEQETETKESKAFGVNTKYLRNIVHARLGGDVDLDDIMIQSAASFTDAGGSSPPTPRSFNETDGVFLERQASPTRPPPVTHIDTTQSARIKKSSSVRRHDAPRQAVSVERQTSGDDTTRSPREEALRERVALIFRDNKGGAALCIWASQTEFEYVKSSECKEMLAHWVGDLTAQAERQGLASTSVGAIDC